MQIIKVTRDPNTGRHKLGRLVTVLGCLTLTFGFYRESFINGLIWQDYIAYATAVTIIYTPSKAKELIDAIRGNQKIIIPSGDKDEKVG